MSTIRRRARTLAVLLAQASLLLQACASTSTSARGNRPAPIARAAARSPLFGLSDDSPQTFLDPRVKWLGIKVARYVVPWDVLTHPSEIVELNAWLAAAALDRVQPLITFDHSELHPKELPSLASYQRQIKRFLKLYPTVRDYTPWDEENHYPEPTAAHPRVAAEYFNALQAACPKCSVTAADVLDQSNMVSWLRRFLPYAHHPRLWGLHNYFDVNGGGHTRTAELLRLVHGDVWFTETGGLVWRYDRAAHRFIVRGTAYAARAAARLLKLMHYSPRITRVYYYHWRIRTTLAQARKRPGIVTWDSGLIAPDCSARPAFNLVARALGRNPAKAPRTVETPDGGFGCITPPPPKTTVG
ncbi:MAG TPA: hypothetical protein VHX88_06935 [Solirubrobacteraceae bacterium]|jgi:hypothetical protein|nr:hypothetical protein [Solirubrobacteraceae bacterium]